MLWALMNGLNLFFSSTRSEAKFFSLVFLGVAVVLDLVLLVAVDMLENDDALFALLLPYAPFVTWQTGFGVHKLPLLLLVIFWIVLNPVSKMLCYWTLV